jgi:ssDNA-binding replication factor A large subunit
LSLWNEDAEKLSVGDKVKVSNGYVGEFRGSPQLSSGKYGKIEKL